MRTWSFCTGSILYIKPLGLPCVEIQEDTLIKAAWAGIITKNVDPRSSESLDSERCNSQTLLELQSLHDESPTTLARDTVSSWILEDAVNGYSESPCGRVRSWAIVVTKPDTLLRFHTRLALQIRVSVVTIFSGACLRLPVSILY